MLADYLKKVLDRTPRFALSARGEETFGKLRGEIFWEMRDMVTGQVTKGKLKNIVTLDASILIARLLKGPGTGVAHSSEPNFGIYALAVGTGDPSWNPLLPPAGTNTQRSLSNELARKAVQSTNFIASNGQISAVPTNVVDYTTTFVESEAVGPITEMGLLGGDINTNMSIRNPQLPPNGTYDPTQNLVGKDTLINYVTFPAISKPATSQLSWTWRITS